jgi:hypothetical protein
LTKKIWTTIVHRWKNNPDDDVEYDQGDDDEITNILFHADSSMFTTYSWVLNFKSIRRLKLELQTQV